MYRRVRGTVGTYIRVRTAIAVFYYMYFRNSYKKKRFLIDFVCGYKEIKIKKYKRNSLKCLPDNA